VVLLIQGGKKGRAGGMPGELHIKEVSVTEERAEVRQAGTGIWEGGIVGGH